MRCLYIHIDVNIHVNMCIFMISMNKSMPQLFGKQQSVDPKQIRPTASFNGAPRSSSSPFWSKRISGTNSAPGSVGGLRFSTAGRLS